MNSGDGPPPPISDIAFGVPWDRISIVCRGDHCGHVFFQLFRDRKDVPVLWWNGQDVYVRSGSLLRLVCPNCGKTLDWHGSVPGERMPG